jgi:hypothetical protein
MADITYKREPSFIEKAEEHESTEPELSPEHRAYLLERHGTVDLDPLPSMDPADPHNWPSWKVRETYIYTKVGSGVR